MKDLVWIFGWTCFAASLMTSPLHGADSTGLEWTKVSSDRKHFVRGESDKKFVAWGVNYDHNDGGALLEDHWHDDWDTVQGNQSAWMQRRADSSAVSQTGCAKVVQKAFGIHILYLKIIKY